MSVNAKFIADFDSFTGAVAKADVELKGLETDASKVESSLNRMADSFSGRKIIQDATLAAEAINQIGGASTLTENEQKKVNATVTEAIAKYQALGLQAPKALTDLQAATKGVTQEHDALASTVTSLIGGYASLSVVLEGLKAAFSFAKDAIESAGALQDLADATGVSTDGLQRLQYIGSAAGVDLQTMARAVENLSAKLAGGDDNATLAVERLGLNVKDLIALGPEKAFTTFATAAASLQDPMDKAAIYTDALGGRVGRLLLALPNLASAMNSVPKGSLITPENVAAADKFDDTLKQLNITVKAYAANFLGDLLRGQSEFSAVMDLGRKAMGDYKVATSDSTTAVVAQNAATDTQLTHAQELQNVLDALRKDALAPLSAAQKDEIDQLNKAGKSLKEIADLTESNTSAVKLYIDAKKEQTRVDGETAVALAKVLAQLAQAEQAYYLDDVARAQIAADQKYQIAVAEAKKKGITDTDYFADLGRLRDLDRQRAEIDAQALSTESTDQLQATAYKLHNTYEAMVADAEHFSTETRRHWGLVADAAADAVHGIQIDVGSLESTSIEHMQQVYVNAQATFEAMTTSGYHYTTETIAHFRQLRDEALDALHHIDNGADLTSAHVDSITESTKRAEAELKKLQDQVFSRDYDLSTQAGFNQFRQLNPSAYVAQSLTPDYFKSHTLQQAIQAGLIDLYAGFKGYASGGTNLPGGWAMVGEKGPELLRMPSGADVIPNSQLGSIGKTTVVVNVQGMVVGSQETLARMIGDILLQQTRLAGTRLAVTRAA
jgi:hypothetical protein